ARFIVAFLCVSMFLPFKPLQLKTAPWGLHLRRSVAGWCGITFLFAAVMVMPLADANAISFLSVIVAMGLAVFMLRERAGPRRWSAACVALLGALLITRPGTSAFQPAAMLALAAAVFMGFEVIFIKQLSGREPVFRILFINNLFGATLSFVVIGFVWQTPTLAQWVLMGLIGSLMLFVQVANIMAMQRGDASFVAPFWYAVPAFAAFYDYLVFSSVVSLPSALGIALIVLGGVIISWREHVVKAETDKLAETPSKQ
ncbi:MAG: DMT family transporter, partial [Pseudomonadota bacterium]